MCQVALKLQQKQGAPTGTNSNHTYLTTSLRTKNRTKAVVSDLVVVILCCDLFPPPGSLGFTSLLSEWLSLHQSPLCSAPSYSPCWEWRGDCCNGWNPHGSEHWWEGWSPDTASGNGEVNVVKSPSYSINWHACVFCIVIITTVHIPFKLGNHLFETYQCFLG